MGALTGPREILSTFREGSHFIIKTVSLVSGGPYGPRGFLSDFEGGWGEGGWVPKVYNRTDPIHVVGVNP